ncbi:hypothetical protein [Massilia sp. DJPM01]|uniref:hypothetical protein n=1 Tax=Massilia sp. DJPM01 TaxID=3024404 RepID=UPI0028056B59|nr:hypothetical protein [Massilia sp. DJPM01]
MIDRLGPMAAEQLTAAQQAAAQAIIDGPRGALYGPFVPLLRSPELIIDGPSIHDLLGDHRSQSKRKEVYSGNGLAGDTGTAVRAA